MPEPSTPSPAVPSTDSTLSGGVWVSGAGFNQVSGGPLAGNIYSEVTQWLNIEYTRNPHQTFGGAGLTEFYNLTSVSGSESKNVYTTQLHFNITVHTSKKKIIQNYSLSASYQPQKFSINANRFDKLGYFYGDVSGPNNLYVFGPQGSIMTTQPYVNRNPWDDATDVEYSLTQQGTNYGVEVSALLQGGVYNNQAKVWGDGGDISRYYGHYLSPGGPNLSWAPRWPYAFSQGFSERHQLQGGGYSTSAEGAFGNNSVGLAKLIQFIEANCAVLSHPNYLFRYPVFQPVSSDGFSQIQEADRLESNPYYSTARHDYT